MWNWERGGKNNKASRIAKEKDGKILFKIKKKSMESTAQLNTHPNSDKTGCLVRIKAKRGRKERSAKSLSFKIVMPEGK